MAPDPLTAGRDSEGLDPPGGPTDGANPTGLPTVVPMLAFTSLVLLVVVALGVLGGGLGLAVALAILVVGLATEVLGIAGIAAGQMPLHAHRHETSSVEDGEQAAPPPDDARELMPSDLPPGAPGRRELRVRTRPGRLQRRPGGVDRDALRRRPRVTR